MGSLAIEDGLLECVVGSADGTNKMLQLVDPKSRLHDSMSGHNLGQEKDKRILLGQHKR